MRVIVQDANSKKAFELDVNPTHTIFELKKMIAEKDQLYQTRTTLLKIAGKAAKQEDQTVEEMGIVEDQTLEIWM